MTGAELINEAISHYDNTNSSDAGNAQRRIRILHAAQMVLDEVYNFKPWPFKRHKVTVETSAGVASLPNYPDGTYTTPAGPPPGYFTPVGGPVSFGRLGPEGAVVGANNELWVETTPQEITAARAAGDSLRKIFSISSNYANAGAATAWDTDGWKGGLYKLEIPNTTEAITLTVYFDAAPIKLADDANQIVAIPPEYHRTVLLAGTITRMQQAKSDTRIYWEKQYLVGLARMAANQMPMQSRVQQLPMFQRGQW